MTKLRQAMMEAMLLRGFSEGTKESYIQGVRGIAAYYHLSPDALSDEQVRHYLLYLLDERKLAYSSANLRHPDLAKELQGVTATCGIMP